MKSPAMPDENTGSNVEQSPFKKLLWQPTGPLTAQLARRPSGFGLGQLPIARVPTATTTIVCGYCSTGCGLRVHLQDGRAVGLSPDATYPVNLGGACPKGWEALAVLDSPERATQPLVRTARGRHRPVDWDTALRLFCDRFKAIQAQHGSHSVAFLGTGQITTEELALLGSFAKFGMGLRHGDGNTRQCMATAVVAYKEAFGFDAPPYSYDDLEESDVIVLVGSNLCIAHPILWQRLLRNPRRPEIIVIDPRRTETAMAATLHIPLRPKSDLTLFYGLARILIQSGAIDEAFVAAHTNGFDDLRTFLQAEAFAPDRVAVETGLDEETLHDLARRMRPGRRVSFWWTMGVNQSYDGVRTAQSLINLALLTGNIGQPGTGANSITGQCNAMGSRLFANTTNLLGGRDFTNPDHRRHVAEVLGMAEERIPREPSWSYDQIIEGILAGKIRGLWVVATNPAHSWINQHMLRDVLGRLDFLVVQDMYHTTETARLADLVMPAAAWGEKDGTFINSERRIGVVRKVARAPGQALADFAIFRLLAHYWGCAELFANWTDPESVFHILKKLSRGQPCDITAIRNYQMLEDCGGVQWPCPEGSGDLESRTSEPPRLRSQKPRLFSDGRFYFPDGRARFRFSPPTPMPEPPSEKFPYLLLTGRGSAAQWHTQTRTKQSAVLRKLYPQSAYVEINPRDARRDGIRANESIIVESQRGSLVAKAVLTYAVRSGQLFIPMHYEATNCLTLAHFDPYSRQPSYKNCAVRIRAARE